MRGQIGERRERKKKKRRERIKESDKGGGNFNLWAETSQCIYTACRKK